MPPANLATACVVAAAAAIADWCIPHQVAHLGRTIIVGVCAYAAHEVWVTVWRKESPKKQKLTPTITPSDRIPAPQPLVRPLAHALREARLVMLEPSARACRTFPGVQENAILILPGGNYDNCGLRGPMEFACWVSSLGLRAYVSKVDFEVLAVLLSSS